MSLPRLRAGLESPTQPATERRRLADDIARLDIRPVFYTLVQARCYDCDAFPCICRRTSRPCACGQDIEPPSLDPAAIAAAVRVHNRSTSHTQWRARAGWG